MLVLQTTYRCSCCGKEPEYNVQVDLPINVINMLLLVIVVILRRENTLLYLSALGR